MRIADYAIGQEYTEIEMMLESTWPLLWSSFRTTDALVLAIPSGGVPVGLVVSSRLDLPFDLLIIRKIPIPGYTESGFGAVSLEGDMVLNEPLVRELGLSPEEIEVLAEPVQEELQARNRIFRENRPWPELAGKTVILVDDGLASGYTMLAAVRVVRRHKALPDSSGRSYRLRKHYQARCPSGGHYRLPKYPERLQLCRGRCLSKLV